MAIEIKPHHYMDMIKLYGSGLEHFVPDLAYGHAFYSVGNEILENPDAALRFTLDCDDVCSTCKFKGENLCQDSVTGLPGYTSKDVYNKMIDRRLVDLLGLDLAKTYSSKAFCALLYDRKQVVFEAWTVEDPAITARRYELFCKGCERYLQK